MPSADRRKWSRGPVAVPYGGGPVVVFESDGSDDGPGKDGLDCEHDILLTLQARSGFLTGAPNLQVTVDYWIGETMFSKVLQISNGITGATTGPIRRLVLGARKVRVTAAWPTNTVPGPGTIQFYAAASLDSSYQGKDGFAPVWTRSLDAAHNAALMVSGSGVMTDATVDILTVPAGGPFYIIAVDAAASPPAAGAPTIPGGASPPILAAPGAVSFGGQDDVLEFSTGLVLALSTTPDQYTAPAAGTCFFQARVGS